MKSEILKLVVGVRGAMLDKRLRASARNLKRAQWRTLRKILKRQANTDFGRAHGFAGMKSAEDYRKSVPVNDYEALRPWIEKQDETGMPSINYCQPVAYAMTSGTTGKPKYIPIMPEAIKSFKALQKLYLYGIMRDRPKVFSGHLLGIVGQAIEGYMPASEIPFGSTSGHIYRDMPGLARSKYVVPHEVFSIDDCDLKFLAILRLAIQCKDISFVSTANPSTLARLVKLLRRDWDALVSGLKSGTFHRMHELTEEQRKAMYNRLKADPGRVEELRQIEGQETVVRFRHVWPQLQAIGTWTGGSCSIFLDQLADEFSPNTLIRDMGYLASEMRGTVPMLSDTNSGVPTLLWNYFEFARQEDWDRGERRFLGLDEVKEGEQYYVFVTTDSGLYRYNMNDIVQVRGSYHGIPLLKFVQKGKGVTSITGEKLYENQLIAAVKKMEENRKINSAFYIMLADEKNAVYRLYYEPTPECASDVFGTRDDIEYELDHQLGQLNIEYASKRKSQRLLPLEFKVLKAETFEKFKGFHVAMGQREGQFKIVALQYARELKFPIESRVMDAEQARARGFRGMVQLHEARVASELGG